MNANPGRTVPILLALLSAVAVAQEPPPAVDTSQWECKFCAFADGVYGEVEAGIRRVTDDSFKFGEYSGLDRGYDGIGNAQVRSNDKADATYFDLSVLNLNQDNRSLAAEGGVQGRYRLLFKYRELPHRISDSARSPYLGIGGDTLTLPGGWVAGGSTGAMTALAGSLQEVDIANARKQVGVGLSYLPAREWELGMNVRRETREGTRRIAGAFLFNGAQLVAPVDYVTDDFDVSASYAARDWQMKLAYELSVFRDYKNAFTWQNAFAPPVAGATAGQLALPPDNRFHQLHAMGAWQLSPETRGTASLAIGRMEQDDGIPAPSLNPGFAAVQSPIGTLQGKVETLKADVKLTSAISDKLGVSASLSRDDRDNQTPQVLVTGVVTDALAATPRQNLPYSYTRDQLKVAADYKLEAREKISGGLDLDRIDRTFQEVARTDEQTLWAKYAVRSKAQEDFSVKLAYAERDGGAYQPVSALSPPENPLLRKYNLADRARATAGLHYVAPAGENVTIGIDYDRSKDDYANSAVGLTRSRESVLGANLTARLTKEVTLHLFATEETIESEQAGAQSFVNPPDWRATVRDVIRTAGIGIKRQALKGKLDLGADLVSSRAQGSTSVNTGTTNPAFPANTANIDSLKLEARYRYTGNLSLNVAFWREHYRSQDWSLDGVDPATLSNVLGLGETSPDYDVDVLSVSLRYSF